MLILLKEQRWYAVNGGIPNEKSWRNPKNNPMEGAEP
jgi:hypothetical protein